MGDSVPHPDPVDALLRFAEAPHTGFAPTDADAFAEPVFGAALGEARGLGPDGLTDRVQRLTAGIAVEDPYQAARVALIVGTLVEWGADPAVAAAPTLARFAEVLALTPTDAAHAARIARSAKFLGLASMAMLCRDPGVRRAARAMPAVVRAVAAAADHLAEAGFVDRVLALVDDLELTVLHPARREGAVVAIEAVASAFHLFTLLQGAFPAWCPADDPVDPELLALATGTQRYDGPHTDHARFHVATGFGIDRDVAATVWGEGSPADVPAIDGVRYLVVGPTMFGGRAWDAGFFANFHDALRPRLRIVRALAADEVDAAVARLRARITG